MENDEFENLSIDELQSIVQEDPNDAINRIALANAYFEAERLEEAEEEYKKALTIDADEEDALYNLAICLVVSKRYKESASYFEKFLKIYPEDEDALHKLGVVYMRLERFEEALALLQKSVVKIPDSCDVQLSVSLAYEALNKGSEAIHHSKQAESLADDMELKAELTERTVELYEKFGFETS